MTHQLARGVWTLPFLDADGHRLMVAIARDGTTPLGFTRVFPRDDIDEITRILHRRLDEVDPGPVIFYPGS